MAWSPVSNPGPCADRFQSAGSFDITKSKYRLVVRVNEKSCRIELVGGVWRKNLMQHVGCCRGDQVCLI